MQKYRIVAHAGSFYVLVSATLDVVAICPTLAAARGIVAYRILQEVA